MVYFSTYPNIYYILRQHFCMVDPPNRSVDTDPDTATDSAAPTDGSESSESVEWRDISVQTNAPAGTESGIDRQSASDRVDSTDTSETAVTDQNSITDRIQACSGESLTVETDIVTATLVGVPRIRVDDLVYAHQRDSLQHADTRACALFDITNTSDVPIQWAGRRTKFIGSDNYSYTHAHVSLDPSQLGPGCYPTQVEIEPGSRARVITPVERLPTDVDVTKVVHTVASRGELGSQRLVFTVN